MSAIEIREVVDMDSCRASGLFAKGHHDPAAFLDAVLAYLGDDPPRHPVRRVRHFWWRTVPVRGGDFESRFLYVKPNARGAFPVTLFEIEEVVL